MSLYLRCKKRPLIYQQTGLTIACNNNAKNATSYDKCQCKLKIIMSRNAKPIRALNTRDFSNVLQLLSLFDMHVPSERVDLLLSR